MNSRFLSNNLSLKIISVIVAIILWLYAVSELNPETTKPIYDVPIEIINMQILNDKNLSLVENPEENVTIRIRGLVNDIRKVNTSNLKAILDLSEIDWTGTRLVELDIEGLLPREVRLDKIPEIELTINDIIKKDIPVVIDLSGDGGDGYHVHDATVEPSTITIYGARSLVDSVVQGVVQVKLDQDKNTINESHPIKLIDASGNPVESRYLSLRQGSAMVNIPIYPIQDKLVRANVVGEPANGFVVDSVTLDPNRVTVNGASSIIERLSALTTEEINIQGATDDIRRTVNIVLENGIYLEPGQPFQVNVVVSISETTIQNTLTVEQVELRNIPEGYTATVENQAVTIQLRGPFTVISGLTSQDLTPAIDLSQLTPAEGELPPGQYELPLILQVPDRAEIIQVSRETITVNVELLAEPEVVEEEAE
ncbi:MAG: YbbR-like domain-containing protein [Caldicoprobacterales bacterium]|jgi:YbbR domain-containing protein|nr:hypothetical protein [Clostridiales bacterium]